MDKDKVENYGGQLKGNYWKEGKYLGIIALLIWLLIWFLITRDGLAIVREIKFPSPLMLIEAAIRVRTVLLRDIAHTMLRVLAGFSTGLILGTGIGILMFLNKKVYYFLNTIIESMRPVPVIAMIPFFLLWFGIEEIGKFILVVSGVFTIMVVNTIEAARNVSPIYIKAAKTLGAKKMQIFKGVIFPAIIPPLIGPIRTCAALSFTLVVAAEFMGAKAGLGFRILESRRLFYTDVIFLGIVLFGILAGLFDFSIRKIIGHVVRWSERAP